MSLRIIYGRAGSGKSTFCLRDIKQKLKEKPGGQFIIIVPEQFSLQAEQRLVRELGGSGINGVEVLSFRRLAYRVFASVGGAVHTHINSAGKSMLLYRAVEKHRDELKVYARTAHKKGFINTLNRTISELKRYTLTTEILMQASESHRESNVMLSNKLSDIALIYEEFENILHSKYIDTDDDLTMLNQKLDGCDLFDGAEFYIDEFSGFTPQEYSVIGKLMKKADMMNVALCTDCLVDYTEIDDINVFSPTQNAAARLIELAKRENVHTEKPINLNNTPSGKYHKELKHLEENLYRYSYKQYKQPTQNISVYMASNIYSEVESTAGDILRLCRDCGMDFGDIAVVTGNLTGYQKLVQAIFAEYGIPCFIDSKRDVVSHPLAQLITNALRIFTENWSYESVFRYLKTGLTGIEKRDIDYIENYVMASGVRGSRWTKDEEWSFRPNYDGGEPTEYEKTMLQRINQIRRAVTQPLINLYDKIKGKNNAAVLCTALFEYLVELQVPERVEQMVEQFKESKQLDLANEYGQIWNIIMELLDQVVEVMKDEVLNIDKFEEILSAGLEEYEIGLIPPALEQVLVGSIERTKSHNVKALYVIGANEGVFPSMIKDDGILTDSDRIILAEQGIELAKDTTSRAFEQQFMVYTTLTTPSDYLRISYSIADIDGGTQRQSMVISKLHRLFPELASCNDIEMHKENELQHISAPAPAFNRLITSMRQHLEGIQIDDIWKDAYNWFQNQQQWKEKCERALTAFNYTNQAEGIRKERVRKLYGSNIYSSISRFEKYASCPFAYYVQYGLKAKERQTFQLSAPDMGSFLHKVIERFCDLLQEENISWRGLEKDWCMATVERLVDELLAELPGNAFNSSKRYRYIAERLKRVAGKSVWVIAQHIGRSKFEPLGHELGFGINEKLPPITIELTSGEKIILNGRIDRIDTMKTGDGTYVRVIDYKSGSKKFKLSDIYDGLSIQLVTYLDALTEKGGHGIEGPVIPAGMLYFKLDDPIIRGGRESDTEKIEKTIMKQLKMKGLVLSNVELVKSMDENIDGDSDIIPARINKDQTLGRSSAASIEQFAMLRRHVKSLLAGLGEEIINGSIAISPYKKKKATPCSYCSYMSICQFDTRLNGNKYRNLQDKKDSEVWEMLSLSKTGKGGDAE
ncbi:MAG: ATP-dependent nuclease subunit [Clostridia bacterium]|jgi:ATP-dependent helicase/nuclease subunit B|nr:ATP-dependent nuclease subunit [Clostridia bacterium]